MSQVAAELGISQTGLSLDHSWVRQLAGAGASPAAVSMSSLQGQTAQPVWNATPSSDSTFMSFSVPFFRGTASSFSMAINVLEPVTLSFSAAPNWSGNIVIKNVSTGNSILLNKQNATTWGGNGSIMRGNVNDTYTLIPSN